MAELFYFQAITKFSHMRTTLSLLLVAFLVSPMLAQAPFAVVELDDEPRPIVGGELLGIIEVKPKVLKGLCEYWTILEEAKQQANDMGANCLLITEHKVPRSSAGCHRLTAQALKLEDVRLYEKEIPWHPERKLTIEDFQASTENRPSLASTAMSIGYQVVTSPSTGKSTVIVTNTFFPRDSYFKPEEENSDYILAHEQAHFDISELFARTFLKRIQEELNTAEDIGFQLQRIYRDLQSDREVYQSAFDAETFEQPGMLPSWEEKIATELHELEAFASKTIELN